MADSGDNSAGRVTGIIGGLCVLALLGYGIFYVVTSVYHHFVPLVPPPAVSLALSAGFDPTPSPGQEAVASPKLRITGTVFENAEPKPGGEVWLSVEDWKRRLHHSVLLRVNSEGSFGTVDDPAFRYFTPGDRLCIRAVYRNGGTTAEEEIFLGARAPSVSTIATVIALGLFLVCNIGFLWLLTGPPGDGKNNVAIIVSYVIMGVFIVIPFVIPDVIQLMSPGTIDVLRDAPVGILIAKQSKDQPEQWVLNIGGKVVREASAPSFGKAPEKAPAGTDGVKGEPQPPAQPAGSSPASTTEQKPAKIVAAASAATQGTTQSPPKAQEPLTKPPAKNQPAADKAQAKENAAAAPAKTGQPKGTVPAGGIEGNSELHDRETAATTIQGGVVVPLFVLVLSILGGAINMTRKLPALQKDASTIEIGKACRRTLGNVAHAATSAVGQIANLSKHLSPAKASQQALNTDNPDAGVVADPDRQAQKSPAGFFAPADDSHSAQSDASGTAVTGKDASVDPSHPVAPETPEQRLVRETAEWREGLVTQHMYLISAPLLAIVVYYLLIWLDMVKPAILVMVSFSVGLMSERIIKRILGIAEAVVEGGSGKDLSAPRPNPST